MFFRSKDKSQPAAEPVTAIEPPTVATAAPSGSAPAAASAAGPGKTLGDITALLMRSPLYGNLRLVDLAWLVLPPLQCGQFALAEARAAETGAAGPAGLVLWAMVSEAVDRRLSADPAKVAQLAPAEWTSGPIPWFICVLGNEKLTGTMMHQVLQTSMRASRAKIRLVAADGSVKVGTVGLKTPSNT